MCWATPDGPTPPDPLDGEGGLDTLTGGSDAEPFLFGLRDGNTDIITDYPGAEGDQVTGVSHLVVGADTHVFDASANHICTLQNYDADINAIAFV